MTSRLRDITAPVEPIELWLIDRQALEEDLSKLEIQAPTLSGDEIARAAAMADSRTGAFWRAGRIALRLLLQHRCGRQVRRKPFAVDPSGRPFLADSNLDFALSDSGAHLLIALSTIGRIGVDIEQPRLLRMTPERVARLVSAAQALGGGAATPLQGWTRIEAFAKATGPSLAAVLARLGVQGHAGGKLDHAAIRERSSRALAASGLHVVDLSLPSGLAGAIAIPRDMPPAPVRVLDHGTIAALVT